VTVEVTQSGAPVTFTPCEATHPDGSAGGVTPSKFSVKTDPQPDPEGDAETGIAKSETKALVKPIRVIRDLKLRLFACMGM
jgi:hypothetical protein